MTIYADETTGTVEVYCDAEIHGATRYDQAEYCDNLATRTDADGNWCDEHEAQPDYDGPDGPPDGPDEPGWWDHAEPQHFPEY